MATPLEYLLMSNNTNQKQEPAKEPSSLPNRGRKPNKDKPAARKKIPQRGMGVAQLERLRLQEINKLESFNIQPAHFSSLPDPIQNFPIRCSLTYANIPPFIINGGGFLSFDHQGLVDKMIENNGSSHSGQFVVNNPCAFGAPHVKIQVGHGIASVFENSKELSSMPKVIHHYQHSSPTSDFWFRQKKRFSGETNKTIVQSFPETTPMNVSDLLGSNLESDSIDLNYHPNGFDAKASRRAVYAKHYNFSGGAEVLAIRRKGNTGGNVFMEYDFFPGKSSSGKTTSTFFKEMEFPSAEASSLTTSDNHSGHNYTTASSSSSSSSNSIDLSLKLSV